MVRWDRCGVMVVEVREAVRRRLFTRREKQVEALDFYCKSRLSISLGFWTTVSRWLGKLAGD